MQLSDGQRDASGAWDKVLKSPIFRPSFRYCTTAFTIWERSAGPLIQLELLQPSLPLLRSNLAILDGELTKRDLPLKLALRADPSDVPERPDGIGHLSYEKADKVADLGVRWDDHLAGSVVCRPEYLDRLGRMLERFKRDVEWVLTTEGLTDDSAAPISDKVWKPQQLSKLIVHEIAAMCKVNSSDESMAADTHAPRMESAVVETVTLLREIRALVKAGVRVRLF